MNILPLNEKPADPVRDAAIAAAKEQLAPYREAETCTIRQCYGDVIHVHKTIEGIGKPDDIRVFHSALWEQAAIDEDDLLYAAVERHRQYFMNYGFPEKPKEEEPK
jgi:hypothetical protein